MTNLAQILTAIDDNLTAARDGLDLLVFQTALPIDDAFELAAAASHIQAALGRLRPAAQRLIAAGVQYCQVDIPDPTAGLTTEGQ